MRRKYCIYFFLTLGSLLICSLPVRLYAQQDPMYTQYMFNTQTINPAYAGTWESVGFMALSRMQWAGMKGAPSTQTFSFQMPWKREKVGIGANIIHDKIGMENRFGLSFDYSYRILIATATSLRMGLKGGFTSYTHNLAGYDLYDEVSDPLFSGEIENKFLPNAGLGFWLENKSYYLGLSIPKLFDTRVLASGNNFALQGEVRHLFLQGGYIYPINRDFVFKPTLLLKMVTGAPVQLDLSANVLVKDKIWLGLVYRTGDSFGMIAQWIFDKKLRIGYAYDYSTSIPGSFHSGTHEVMISYELKFVKQDVISPRYF